MKRNKTNTTIKEPKISIIVPVYQVFPYLRECLDSILEQSFTDWEMLLVDDGSTDGSELMCDEYALKDNRIIAFHQSNQSLGAARNVGLNHAHGEYITFFDSDDVILCKDYLKFLYDAIIEHNAQVSMCKLISFDDGDTIPEPNCESNKYETLTGRDIFVNEPYCKDVQLFSMAVFKLYHKSCFEHIRYPEGRILEDLSVFHHLFYPLKKVVLLDKYMYGRRFRKGSIIISTRNNIQYKDMLIAMDDCIRYLENKKDYIAVDFAKLRKAKHTSFYFFRSLKEGSFDDIPNDIRPKIIDFENLHSLRRLLISIRKADPEYKDTHIRDYLTLLGERAAMLLRITSNYVLFGNIVNNLSENDVDHFYKLAESENILSVTQASLGNNNDEHLIRCTRQYIQMQNEWKKIKKSICDNKQCMLPIPLVPTKVISLYKSPWFKLNNNHCFLIDAKSINILKQIMEKLGYKLVANDPLESNRSYYLSFVNSNHIKFTFIYNVPYYLSGTIKTYYEYLFKELLNCQREMSIMEYSVLLLLKLQLSNIHSASASLSDLLDLILILHNNYLIPSEEGFQKALDEYMLEEQWNITRSIYKTVISSEDLATLQDDEKTYLKELVSRPFLRTSYFDEISSSLLKSNRLFDPVEYTVLKEKELIYLVNSKVACTSIKACMLEYNTTNYNLVHINAYAKGVSKNTLTEEENDYFKFTFVRNPFARLVSCYKSKYIKDKSIYDDVFAYRDYLNGYLYSDEGFDEFIKKVCALPYRLMERHFRLQYSLVYNENGISRCDYIGKFENLAEEFKIIQEKNHLRTLPHLNKVGTDDWMNYYTIETATLVYNTFQKDFEYFGYKDCFSNLVSYLNVNNYCSQGHINDLDN